MSRPRPLAAKVSSGAPAAARPRASLRLRCEAALWRHGLWPVPALLLLCLAAWMWFVERPAAEQALTAPAPRLATGAGRPASAAGSDEAGDVQRLAIFRNTLQPQADTTALVQRLVELTRQDLAWRQAEFQHSEDRPLNLLRTQITVPVAGTYPRLRQALDLALRELPNLSIDQVLFQRQSSGESTLNARVRLSFWLELPPSDAARAPMPAAKASALAGPGLLDGTAVPEGVPVAGSAAASSAGSPIGTTAAAVAAGAQHAGPKRIERAAGAASPAMPASTAPIHSPGGRR